MDTEGTTSTTTPTPTPYGALRISRLEIAIWAIAAMLWTCNAMNNQGGAAVIAWAIAIMSWAWLYVRIVGQPI
jgi:hypothetical protein